MKSSFNPNSNFLGILEGKRKSVVEEQKRQTAQLEADLLIQTSDVKAREAAEQKELLQLQSLSKMQTYGIIAVIVIIIMTGLYFIVKS